MCDCCLLLPLYAVAPGALVYLQSTPLGPLSTLARRFLMIEAPNDPPAPTMERRDEIGLQLKQLLMNLGLDEARYGQSLSLDEIADGVDVTRDDLVQTIYTAFPDVDVDMLRATGTVGDVMDLVLAEEEDAVTGEDLGSLSSLDAPPDGGPAGERADTSAPTFVPPAPETHAGPITGGPTDGPAELPPAAAGETPTLTPVGEQAFAPAAEPVGNTGAAEQASDAAASGSER